MVMVKWNIKKYVKVLNKTKNNISFKNSKSKDKNSKIPFKSGNKFSKDLGKIIFGRTGLNINTKDEKEVKKAKNKLSDLFATKKRYQNSEDSESEENIVSSTKKKTQEEETKDFSNLLSRINNVDYKGYNYEIKDSDYFRDFNGKKDRKILELENKIKKNENKLNIQLI